MSWDDQPNAPPPRRARLKSYEEELDELWDLACNGAESAAYPRLQELTTRIPEQFAAYVRLYWLLRVAPELEPARQAVDWLFVGMRRSPGLAAAGAAAA